MNFDYTEDQLFLKEQARKFLEAACTSEVTRAVLDNKVIGYDRKLWQSVVEMGWMGVAIPERHGGVGMGHIELCAIAEELGRAIAPIPFASTVYVLSEAIMKAGSELQKADLLPRIVTGEVIGCLATSEGRGYTRADAMTAKVTSGRLSGVKMPVTDGDVASHGLVLAQGDEGPGLFLVDLSVPGVERKTLPSIDPTRSVAELRFSDVPCEIIGEEGRGEALVSDIMNRAAVLLAFEQVGGSERCLEMAKDYAMERYAFGQQIARNQAIKHKLADIYVKKEIARSNAYYGAWALAADADELPEAAAAARVAACLSYEFAAQENLQIHGGMGFTWEVDCHLHLRRARQLGLVLGGLPVWREKLVSVIETANAA